MTSKLKCPYSEEELKEIRNNFKGNKPVCPVCPWCNQPKVLQDDMFVCANTDCSACAEPFLHKALIQAKQDLEIATKAMNQVMSMGAKNNICYHLKAKTVKSILGNALEQIEHKEI